MATSDLILVVPLTKAWSESAREAALAARKAASDASKAGQNPKQAAAIAKKLVQEKGMDRAKAVERTAEIMAQNSGKGGGDKGGAEGGHPVKDEHVEDVKGVSFDVSHDGDTLTVGSYDDKRGETFEVQFERKGEDDYRIKDYKDSTDASMGPEANFLDREDWETGSFSTAEVKEITEQIRYGYNETVKWYQDK